MLLDSLKTLEREEQNIWLQLEKLSESLKVGHLLLDFEQGLHLFRTTNKVDRV